MLIRTFRSRMAKGSFSHVEHQMPLQIVQFSAQKYYKDSFLVWFMSGNQIILNVLKELHCIRQQRKLVPSREDSDQSVFQCSLISFHYPLQADVDPRPSEDSDQTAHSRSLIWVFAGCTYRKVLCLSPRWLHISFIRYICWGSRLILNDLGTAKII